MSVVRNEEPGGYYDVPAAEDAEFPDLKPRSVEERLAAIAIFEDILAGKDHFVPVWVSEHNAEDGAEAAPDASTIDLTDGSERDR